MHTHSLVCFKDLINDCDCVSGEKRLASRIYRYWVMCLFCKVPMWDQSDVEVGKWRKKAKTIRDIFKSLKKGLEYWKHMSLYTSTGKEYSSREDDSDYDRGGLTLPLSIPLITPVSQASIYFKCRKQNDGMSLPSMERHCGRTQTTLQSNCLLEKKKA